MRLKNKAPYVDYLIVMLHLEGYTVRINNNNIGDIHNIDIYDRDGGSYHYTLQLSSQQDELINILQDLLHSDYMTYDEWFSTYFDLGDDLI